jgi:AraC-like DNA-binding protein
MTVREIIHILCTESEMSISTLAEEAGMNQGNLSRAISADHEEGMTMKVCTLLKLLRCADAQISVITPRGDEYPLDDEFISYKT